MYPVVVVLIASNISQEKHKANKLSISSLQRFINNFLYDVRKNYYEQIFFIIWPDDKETDHTI